MMPMILLTVGQAIVIIGGGVDLSAGTMVSVVNSILVTRIVADSQTGDIVGAFAIAFVVALAMGAVNGFAVAFLRLQPIVTTYATSFIFTGVALWVLPRPGGNIPRPLVDLYRNPQIAGIPTPVFIIVLVLLFWWMLRNTRYGQYLFATGGKADAAYTTGVPVEWMRFSTYVLSAVFAFLAGITLTLLTASGAPNSGNDMTLNTIVAVVLGGTALSGGRGGIAGPMMGWACLLFISNIISFGNVSSWNQDLVKAFIIVVALAIPGITALARTGIRTRG